jgi:hypothetical protein
MSEAGSLPSPVTATKTRTHNTKIKMFLFLCVIGYKLRDCHKHLATKCHNISFSRQAIIKNKLFVSVFKNVPTRWQIFVQYFIPCKRLYMIHDARTDEHKIHRCQTGKRSLPVQNPLQFVTTRCCNYSLFELLMIGECFTRNMYSLLQGIKYCTKKSVILLEYF